MKYIKLFIIPIIIQALLFVGCTKSIPNSFGRFDKPYSCLAVLPFSNESSFGPLNELLHGYLDLEMYQKGLQEVMNPDELARIYREEGDVYFPARFNQSLAIEYATLLGLDGAFFGTLSSPDRVGSNLKGVEKPLNVEVYFLDVKSSKITWSFTKRLFITPGNYNKDIKALSKDITRAILSSGFKYSRVDMPCWDAQLASYLKRLPDITREMFNSLSLDLADSKDEDTRMNLGNIFMTVGKRSLALTQYRQYLRQNPASPFKGEVEKQVAVITRSIR